DLIAFLHHREEPARQVCLITEAKTEPKGGELVQVGVYELLLAAELGEGVEIDSVLLVLTGRLDPAELRLGIRGTGRGHHVAPYGVCLECEDAAKTLKEIAERRLDLSVLPWLPLMAGGGETGFIEEWKKVAEAETDLERRGRYRDWALVFAELSKRLVNWQ